MNAFEYRERLTARLKEVAYGNGRDTHGKATTILVGACKDWGDYKFDTGWMTAIAFVLEEMDEVMKDLSGDSNSEGRP